MLRLALWALSEWRIVRTKAQLLAFLQNEHVCEDRPPVRFFPVVLSQGQNNFVGLALTHHFHLLKTPGKHSPVVTKNLKPRRENQQYS